MADDSKGRLYIPDTDVCKRYGITPMTLWRWDHDPDMGFPKPIRLGKRRKYRVLSELEAWERARAAKS